MPDPTNPKNRQNRGTHTPDHRTAAANAFWTALLADQLNVADHLLHCLPSPPGPPPCSTKTERTLWKAMQLVKLHPANTATECHGVIGNGLRLCLEPRHGPNACNIEKHRRHKMGLVDGCLIIRCPRPPGTTKKAAFASPRLRDPHHLPGLSNDALQLLTRTEAIPNHWRTALHWNYRPNSLRNPHPPPLIKTEPTQLPTIKTEPTTSTTPSNSNHPPIKQEDPDT